MSFQCINKVVLDFTERNTNMKQRRLEIFVRLSLTETVRDTVYGKFGEIDRKCICETCGGESFRSEHH